MIGLHLLDGHAGNRFIKLANGATVSLSVYILSLCSCLPSLFTLTKMLMQHSQASHLCLNVTVTRFLASTLFIPTHTSLRGSMI